MTWYRSCLAVCLALSVAVLFALAHAGSPPTAVGAAPSVQPCSAEDGSLQALGAERVELPNTVLRLSSPSESYWVYGGQIFPSDPKLYFEGIHVVRIVEAEEINVTVRVESLSGLNLTVRSLGSYGALFYYSTFVLSDIIFLYTEDFNRATMYNRVFHVYLTNGSYVGNFSGSCCIVTSGMVHVSFYNESTGVYEAKAYLPLTLEEVSAELPANVTIYPDNGGIYHEGYEIMLAIRSGVFAAMYDPAEIRLASMSREGLHLCYGGAFARSYELDYWKLYGILGGLSVGFSLEFRLADEVYFEGGELHLVNPNPAFSVSYAVDGSKLYVTVTHFAGESFTAELLVPPPPRPPVPFVPAVNHYYFGVRVTAEESTPYMVRDMFGNIVSSGMLHEGENILYLPDGWYVLETAGGESHFIVTGMLLDVVRSNFPAFAQLSLAVNAVPLTLATAGVALLALLFKRWQILLAIPFLFAATPVIYFIQVQPLLALI